MENVLCYKREELPRKWLMEMGALAISEKELKRGLQGLALRYIEKNKVEHDYAYKQLIPYIVLTDHENRVFYYKRRGSEKRLSQLYSIGIGGHVNREQDHDEELLTTIHNGLKRELLEETGVPYVHFQSRFCGIINEEKSKVGKTHLGLVYCLRPLSAQVKYQFSDELILNGYETMDNFIKNYEHEYWSDLALQLMSSV